jgi:hypothetical protein
VPAYSSAERSGAEKIKVLKYHSHFLTHAFDIADIFIQLDTINHNASLLMFFKMVNTANGCGFPEPEGPQRTMRSPALP